MKLWPSRPVPFSAAVPSSVPPVKGVTWDISSSHEDNFQTNRVSVRTVTFSDYGTVGSYALMYRRQPAVRAVVDFLARNIAQLNPKVYERVSTTDRLEQDNHPLALRLRRPNPSTTRYRHQRDTIADLAIYDRAYWWKMRQRGRLSAIVRIPPAGLNITTNEAGRAVYTLLNGTEVPRADLVIFSGYDPSGGEQGVSPLETLRRVLAEEAAAVAFRESMWSKSASAGGWITRPADAAEWSDEARIRFREEFEAMYSGGSNAGKTGILEEGMTFERDTFSPPAEDYIAGRRLTYEEVAIAYGVPPSIVGMGSETKSNAEAFHRQMYQDVLGPWLRMLQDEIELQLLSEFEPVGSGTYVEFNLKEKLRGAFEEEQRAITTGVGVPHMSVNEGRARQNLPRINESWADAPVRPMNVLYGGQPAVTVPTADPGTASASPPRVKAAGPQKAPEGALRRRESAAKDHEELFRRFFERQEKDLTSKKSLPERERWDRELTADLFLLATQTARRNGQLAAQQIGGVYDEKRTLAWLVENARIAAESINEHTFDLLEDAEDPAEVFEVAKGSRSEQLGLGRATALIAFARTEAARHSEDADGKQRTKTWVVTSGKSRHPQMSGETVPVGEDFSNGMPYPGAAGAGADEVAGCRCLLQIN